MPQSSSRTLSTQLGIFAQIPQEYAKPIRRTSYLMAYPHVLNGGRMMPGESKEFPDVLLWNTPRNALLTQYTEDNVVSYTADRVMDVRGMQKIP